jgi:hypothetical protein
MANPKTSFFRGLNTVDDTVSLGGLGWLKTADNVHVLGTGEIERRQGAAKVLAATGVGVFTTLDFSRMYLVDGANLLHVLDDLTTVLLKTLTSTAPMDWTELNRQVYFSNGVDSGIITADGRVLDWAWAVPTAPNLARTTGSLSAGRYQVCCTYLQADGRETGSGDVAEIDIAQGDAFQVTEIPQVAGLTTLVYIAPANSSVFGFAFTTTNAARTWNAGPDAIGTDLTTHMMRPLPAGSRLPTACGSRVCVIEYMAAKDQTVIWFAQPMAPHLFDQKRDFALIPGEVVMLAPLGNTAVIGTRSKVFTFDLTSRELNQIANYGTVPGYAWARDGESSLLFWTTRGICRALPFENLTEKAVSFPSGARAAVALMERRGNRHIYVALQDGGIAFNP